MIEATKVFLNKDYESIYVEFVKGNNKGSFHYMLFGDGPGIFDTTYLKDEDEDIYDEIHSWVEDNIISGRTIKYKGKILGRN